MFSRIARVVGNLFTVVDDAAPSNRVCLAVEGLEDRCTPATLFIVDTVADFADDNPGNKIAGKIIGKNRFGDVYSTSLRSAIQEGNALKAAGQGNDYTIQFDMETMTGSSSSTSAAVISVGSELPLTTANFFIEGPGRERLTIERSLIAAAKYRIFSIGVESRVSITNLSVSGGAGDGDGGGGIRSVGDLTVIGCDFVYNETTGRGGAILAASGIPNYTRLVVNDCFFCSNQAAIGGGIAVWATKYDFEMQVSTLTSNTATLDGGGLYIGRNAVSQNGNPRATIDDSTITTNGAGRHGGGIFAAGSFLMLDGQIDNNSASSDGGGIYLDSAGDAATDTTLLAVSVTNNSAGNKGGGFYIRSGTFVFTNSPAFSGNKATQGIPGGAWRAPGVCIAPAAGMPPGAQAIEEDL